MVSPLTSWRLLERKVTTSPGKLCATLCLLAFCSIAVKKSCAASPGQAASGQEKLIWSDEFNSNAPQSAPDPQNWSYNIGGGGWGNSEYETYCAYASNTAPCNQAEPNAYVSSDGYLHIVARNPAKRIFTSARLKSQGLRSFRYGRIEARIKMPAGQGFWPAFWMLGDTVNSVKWPACGEIDIMESVGKMPTTNFGSIHGSGFTGASITTAYTLPGGAKFADTFHIFGILWSPRQMKFYVDDPSNVYATYTPASLTSGGVWPFDSSKFFFILNLAVGGNWPGAPDASSVFPQEMLVDYVRVYQEPGN
jgi:beta-glucanase (GH16 family)